MNEPHLTFSGDVQRLALQPGDVVIIRTAEIISAETAARLREHCRRVFEGHEVLVLGPGVSVEVAGAPT